MTRTVVVALGGNAITRSGQAGTYEEQAENARALASAVHRLHGAGWAIVLVHGNGPQVGNLAIQQEAGAHRVPELPLFLLGAMTEGHLGCLLALALREVGGPDLPPVVPVVTHVVVDAADPAFARPSKPIGPFFDEADARSHADEHGWIVGADAGRGFRRLVPSPQPLAVLELDAVRALVDGGMIAIVAGGGGVPVVADGAGYRGVNAVIDKDAAARCVAAELGAEALVMITDVPRVMLGYGTTDARAIGEMSADEAQEHLDGDEFPEGSMGPKVRAAIRFVREGGRLAVITDAERACASLDSGAVPDMAAGTRIVATGTRMGAVT